MPFVFLYFIMAAIPHVKYDVGYRWENEFVIYTSSERGNERWQLMSKLAQFTDVHFLALTQNSYDNSNNMKLDLNVSTRLVNFSANNQGL